MVIGLFRACQAERQNRSAVFQLPEALQREGVVSVVPEGWIHEANGPALDQINQHRQRSVAAKHILCVHDLVPATVSDLDGLPCFRR